MLTVPREEKDDRYSKGQTLGPDAKASLKGVSELGLAAVSRTDEDPEQRLPWCGPEPREKWSLYHGPNSETKHAEDDVVLKNRGGRGELDDDTDDRADSQRGEHYVEPASEIPRPRSGLGCCCGHTGG